MKVKKEYVSITKAERIFIVIKQVLSKTKNIQVFVEKDLIEELRRNWLEHHVYEFRGFRRKNYNEDSNYLEEEIWYEYHEDNAFSRLISSASLIPHSKNYYQLVEFPNRNVPSDYILHDVVKFEEILVIKVDTIKNVAEK